MAPIYNISDVLEVQKELAADHLSGALVLAPSVHQRHWRSTFGYLLDSRVRNGRSQRRMRSLLQPPSAGQCATLALGVWQSCARRVVWRRVQSRSWSANFLPWRSSRRSSGRWMPSTSWRLALVRASEGRRLPEP